MSLRIRLFLMLSGLVLLLVLAQWWWVRSLARGLTEEVDAVALQVGNSVAQIFAYGDLLHPPASVRGADCAEGADGCEEVTVVGRMIRRTTIAGVETIEDRTFSWQGDELGKAHARASSNARKAWINEPNPDQTDERIALHYSFRIQQDCEEGEVECLADDPRFVVVRPHEGTSLLRHLVLHVDVDPQGAPVAAASSAGNGIGVRRIPIPGEGVRARIEGFSNRLWLGASALLTLGLIAAAVVAHRVSAPLRRLSDAAAQVGDGALGTQVDTTGVDREVGQALGAFNRMSGRLASLDRANRELAAHEHLGEIGDIARGLAHTLRNPLNALGLSLEAIVVEAEGGRDTEELVAASRRQIRRIDGSIRSFLALTSHGGAVETVSLTEMARDVALEALQDAGGRVRVEVETEGEPRIEAVAPELRAVLQALVVNAIEASPDGGEVRVSVASLVPGLAQITVTDRGPGLPETIRKRLFTPHQTTKADGSGMGLFLAHRIATMRYGGNLRLDDREGGGTIALLELGNRMQGGEGTMTSEQRGPA